MSIASDDEKRRDDADGEADIAEADTALVIVPPKRSMFKSVVLVLTCTFAMIVNSANNTAVAISLSTIGRELNVDETQLEWLVSAYPLSSGCLLLVFGRLADLYGRKKTFILGSFVLAAFTLGCAFANDSITLDILRGFQGIGAAATIPASLGILAHAFPPSKARSIAFSTFAAGAPVGAAFGMALGGVLTQITDKTWRSPFHLETGLTVLCLLGGLASFDADLPSTEVDRRIDWLGAFLVTAGLVLIVFVLGQGEIAPQRWKTPYIIALLVLGVFLIVIFLFWQSYLEQIALASSPASTPSSRRSSISLTSNPKDLTHVSDNETAKNNNGTDDPNNEHASDSPNKPKDRRSWMTPPPLMKISLWRRAKGRFAVMMAIAFLTWCSFLAWGYWSQLYYQSYIGYSPVRTVVRLLPMFVSGIICNMLVAVLIGYIPMLYLVVTGTLGTSLACLLFAVIRPASPYWAFGFPGAIVSVIGADFVFAAGTLFIAKVAEHNEQSLAGALFQTMTQLGTSLGVTVTTVIFNRVTLRKATLQDPHPAPTLESYKAAQWGAFAFGILATLLTIVFFRGVGVVGHRKKQVDVWEEGQESGVRTDQERTAVGGGTEKEGM
ncbi:hypothetical protein Hypma_002885 [Hypsizygus marmoreus]|uniref:Major facilitator superfamily (MFS) profile domain-containing protein n=1 Tax=Hypsizygus marmoreus TaxID=39966 RepID=A0A369J2W1_HYPMA|nr:hypothetical protein Hypma_002885 [Hypsizygus marmoreus]